MLQKNLLSGNVWKIRLGKTDNFLNSPNKIASTRRTESPQLAELSEIYYILACKIN
jgi:hypothetical protein